MGQKNKIKTQSGFKGAWDCCWQSRWLNSPWNYTGIWNTIICNLDIKNTSKTGELVINWIQLKLPENSSTWIYSIKSTGIYGKLTLNTEMHFFRCKFCASKCRKNETNYPTNIFPVFSLGTSFVSNKNLIDVTPLGTQSCLQGHQFFMPFPAFHRKHHHWGITVVWYKYVLTEIMKTAEQRSK